MNGIVNIVDMTWRDTIIAIATETHTHIKAPYKYILYEESLFLLFQFVFLYYTQLFRAESYVLYSHCSL